MDFPEPVYRRKLRRVEEPGHCRYLTFSCYKKMPLFGNPAIRDAFMDRLAKLRDVMRFELYAYVVMPEHVHLLVGTGRDELTVTQITRALKSRFAQEVIGRWRELGATELLTKVTDEQGVARFWQRGGGYDRNIDGEAELLEKIEYVHANPVRRGLVKTATEWKWSSARWYAGERDGVRMDRWD